MTFAELALQISRNVWPQGEARVLKPLHNNLLRDGLIDLQKKVPCLQSQNIDHIPYGATFFFCGASAFSVPCGYVRSLRTIAASQNGNSWKQCDAVWAKPETREEFECRLENAAQCGESLIGCGCGYPITMPYGYYCIGDGNAYPYPELPFGLMYADAITDKTCRARERWFAMFNCYIYTYPVINSNEEIILEWHGIKRNWVDSDLFPYLDETSEPNRQVIQALEYYVMAEDSFRTDCDREKSLTCRALYDKLVAEMIWQCRETQRLPSREHCFVDCNC